MTYHGIKNIFTEISQPSIHMDNEFISLGDHCVISLYMKKFGLKSQSYPFDWIISNMDIVIDILENKFVTFIDNPVVYEEKLPTKKIFYHHSIDKDKDYFKRCVCRFQNLIDKNCTFYMSISHTGGDKITQLNKNHRKYSHDDYLKLYRLLENYCKNCKLVIINIYNGTKNLTVEQIDINIYIYNIYGKLWGGILDKHSESELLQIFNNHKIF